MDYIHAIHYFNDIDYIIKNIKNNDIRSNNELIDIIYKTDTEMVKNYIEICKEISFRKSDIDELIISSSNVINNINRLLNNQHNESNIIKFVKIFNHSIEDFELNYHKYIDRTHINLVKQNDIISKLIQFYILNNNGQIVEEDIVFYINNIYSDNQLFAVQMIFDKMKYIHNMKHVCVECRKMICKTFYTNTFFVIYILIVKLRERLVELSTDPIFKKYIFYDIDIEAIKYDIQFDLVDKRNLHKSINILSEVFLFNTSYLLDSENIFDNLFNSYINSFKDTQTTNLTVPKYLLGLSRIN